jgi:hypothetical protein
MASVCEGTSAELIGSHSAQASAPPVREWNLIGSDRAGPDLSGEGHMEGDTTGFYCAGLAILWGLVLVLQQCTGL